MRSISSKLTWPVVLCAVTRARRFAARVRAMMMAGLDGVQNKINPGAPIDKNLYELEAEEAKNIPHPCASLDEALETLNKDRAFLTKGGVFSDDMLDAYIALKEEEVTRFRMSTHPVEFDMYYSL
jgi:glutamine synthetase